jgi:hypothetical protein
MDETQEKADVNDRKPIGFGRKSKDRYTHRNNKRNEKEETDSKIPKAEEPVIFNAHALDMEPGVITVPRPSLDLTYIDFTRESYEAGEKPFVPKKKKLVPFELSDTPHMQTEYWEGKTPGRRKLLNQADNAAASETKEEPRRTRETRNQGTTGYGAERNAPGTDNEKGKDRDKREDRLQKPEKPEKPEKGKLTRKIIVKKQDEQVTEPSAKNNAEIQENARRQDHAKQGKNTKRRDQTVAQSSGKKPDNSPVRARDHRETREETNAGTRGPGTKAREHAETNAKAPTDNSDKKSAAIRDDKPETVKESLMRPYWMKKKR